jgi:hypothetical protein
MQHQRTLISLFALCALLTAGAAYAAGHVQLEIVGDQAHGSPMAFQEWLQALKRAGVPNVKLRSGRPGDKPEIDVQGTPDSPVYHVTALLGAGDQLVVPGARFRRSEAKQLVEWLDDLAKRGPAERREALGPFGLTAKQFQEVRDDLARPAGFTTRGLARSEAIEKLRGRLGLPLQIEGELEGGDDKLEEELGRLSCGTALACVLRPMGFAMTPREAGGRLGYAVAKAKLDKEVWPVGWPPEKSQPELLPALFELRNVNVQGVSAAKVLEVIAKQLDVPVLMDHNALARYGIEPDKVGVSLPQQRTSYSIALRRLLFKAGLKFEVRADEAGKPFFWISTVKPV